MKKCMTLGRISVSVLLALVMLVSSFVGIITISAEGTETEPSASGIIGISVSLSEDIIVNFKTTAVADDGSSVKLTFNGKDYELTAHASDTFSFVNVTPQNMGDLITAQMYDKDGTTVGDEKTFSVQSYLETLLSYEFGSEFCTCESKLQHTALHELCVNMLNYGAAAQTYVSHDTENLANKNLSNEQKALATAPITVTESDKAVNGSAWVGAGVRFDYKLGLYFVFRAESATEYTATINGEPADIEAYPALGENAYVIRYNGFNATNMNDVVTAKLTKDGADEQTFAYSVKSYVSSKGGDTSNIANLVNAMYTYGFAAVAYSAEYVEVKPTFETAGSLTMDGKGYDFSESVYGSVVLPVLTAANYDTNTTNSGTETAPKVATEFILKHKLWAYSLKFDDATDCVNINGTLASKYDYEKFNSETIKVERSDTAGYTVTATDATLTTLATYGAELTIKGTLTMDLTTPEGGTAPTWTLYNNTTLGDGTEDGKATVAVANAAGNGVVLNGSTADMLVTKESTLSDNIISVNNSTLIVDGTVTANTRVQSAGVAPTSSAYETGYRPSIYIRSGTLTAGHIKTNCMQIGSEKDVSLKGTLNLTGPNWVADATRNPLIFRVTHQANSRHFWLNGTINAKNDKSGSSLLDCKVSKSHNYKAHVVIGENMSFVFDKTVDGLFYCNQNTYDESQYFIYWHAGVANPAPNYFIYTNQANVDVFVWKEADVFLGDDTETTRVLVATKETLDGLSDGDNVDKGFKNPTIEGKLDGIDNAKLTSDGTTITDNQRFGTLNGATYTYGGTDHTVYYRVLG